MPLSKAVCCLHPQSAALSTCSSVIFLSNASRSGQPLFLAQRVTLNFWHLCLYIFEDCNFRRQTKTQKKWLWLQRNQVETCSDFTRIPSNGLLWWSYGRESSSKPVSALKSSYLFLKSMQCHAAEHPCGEKERCCMYPTTLCC